MLFVAACLLSSATFAGGIATVDTVRAIQGTDVAKKMSDEVSGDLKGKMEKAQTLQLEIQELKSILKRADKNSLVLGDELCSGTESISAMAIITTGLKELCERKTSFIFTSHLHQLTELSEIKQLSNLEIYHLKINYERSTNTLIYDRKLEKGSGPSIYGLKVCEAMGLSKEFISHAKSIQKNLECKAFHNSKISQYNPNVFMDECKICKKQENLETHHIKDQKYSDNNKMINHHHQNI